MRILIAEDDPVSRRMLEAILGKWGYEVMVTENGQEAWQVLQAPSAPPLAILDWMMPERDGAEVCRLVRQSGSSPAKYLILLTAKGRKEDVVLGLEAGADDYITKPFNREELQARIRVGERIIGLQTELSHRVVELEQALNHIKTLQGILPICSYCKKIRNDQNYWQQVEHYVAQHSQAEFSHGICPDCYERHVKPELEKLRQRQKFPSERLPSEG